MPMHAGHILLGRPRQFDKDTIHYGRENAIVFRFKGKRSVVAKGKKGKERKNKKIYLSFGNVNKAFFE